MAFITWNVSFPNLLKRACCWLFSCLLLTACGPAGQPLSLVYTVTPDLNSTFAETPNPAIVQPLAQSPTVGPCGFNWARKNLPELSQQLLARMNEAALPVLSASAEAYGEDCLYSDGSLAYFAAMETDYHVTLAVGDLSDAATLGSLLEQTLAVIDQFPVGETPGPNPGYIGIVFQAGDMVETVQFPRTQADTLRAQGLSGAQFYEALKSR